MSYGFAGFSPIVHKYQAPCKVLVDPHSDRVCGNPALSGHTALDMPICDDCWNGVQDLAG